MGVEFATKKLKVKDKVIKLQIWDTVQFELHNSGWPRILPHNNPRILQKRYRNNPHVRPERAINFQEHQELV